MFIWHIWIQCSSLLLHMIQRIIHALYPRPHSRQILHRNWKQYFAKLWVVTKVYYGQYKSGLYNEPYNSKHNLKPTNRPKTLCYKIFTVMTLCSLLQNNAHYIPPHFLLVKFPQTWTTQVFDYRFLRQVGLSTLAMLRKHGTVGILNAICMFTSEL